MEFLTNLLMKTTLQVWVTFTHNWPFLLVSVLMAVGLKLFVDPVKISSFLKRYRRAGVVGATVAAVATPLCSCGTTAVILGMMASTIPWAPIIAFMVASPLTSPEELLYSAGLFGWPFALMFFGSSIVLGLLGGLFGEVLERRGWLANQSRFAASAAVKNEPLHQTAAAATCTCESTQVPVFTARPSLIKRPEHVLVASVALVEETGWMSQAACCSAPVTSTSEFSGDSVIPVTKPCACDKDSKGKTVEPTCACEEDQQVPKQSSITWRWALTEAFTTGKRLLLMFLGFAFIGYLLNGLIPSGWVASIFGQGNTFSVPLAATLGLPLYINTEGSLPLVRALIDGGMSQGAAMAFLITGAGTSIGAIAGAVTIARWRVIAVVIGTLWVGAIAMGYLYNFLLITGLF